MPVSEAQKRATKKYLLTEKGRKKDKEAKKRYYEKNKEKIRKRALKWYHNNRAKVASRRSPQKKKQNDVLEFVRSTPLNIVECHSSASDSDSLQTHCDNKENHTKIV